MYILTRTKPIFYVLVIHNQQSYVMDSNVCACTMCIFMSEKEGKINDVNNDKANIKTAGKSVRLFVIVCIVNTTIPNELAPKQ